MQTTQVYINLTSSRFFSYRRSILIATFKFWFMAIFHLVFCNAKATSWVQGVSSKDFCNRFRVSSISPTFSCTMFQLKRWLFRWWIYGMFRCRFACTASLDICDRCFVKSVFRCFGFAQKYSTGKNKEKNGQLWRPTHTVIMFWYKARYITEAFYLHVCTCFAVFIFRNNNTTFSRWYLSTSLHFYRWTLQI